MNGLKMLKRNIFLIVCFALSIVFFVLSTVLPFYTYSAMFHSETLMLSDLINYNSSVWFYIIGTVVAILALTACFVLCWFKTNPNRKSLIRGFGFVLSIIAAFIGYFMVLCVFIRQNMLPFEFADHLNYQAMEFGYISLLLSNLIVGFTSCYTAARFSD